MVALQICSVFFCAYFCYVCGHDYFALRCGAENGFLFGGREGGVEREYLSCCPYARCGPQRFDALFDFLDTWHED